MWRLGPSDQKLICALRCVAELDRLDLEPDPWPQEIKTSFSKLQELQVFLIIT